MQDKRSHMIDKDKVKEIMFSLGADLCGIAGMDRFDDAPEGGSMIWLGTVLCEQEWEPDERGKNLCDNCNLCVEACPVHALDDAQLKQQNCWDFAFGDDAETQTWRISCHKCRDVCPYNLGSQNAVLSANSQNT